MIDVKNIRKPLATQEAMRTRIGELGEQISHDYQGKDLVVVWALKGAYVFLPIWFG